MGEICKSEPVQFRNGLKIRFAGIAHDHKLYSKMQAEIIALIREHTFVASEADPRFLPNTESKSTGILFYRRLLSDVWQERRDLLYVDPQDLNLNGAEPLMERVSLAGLILGTAKTLTSVYNRRAFLGWTLATTASAIMFGSTSLGYKMTNDSNSCTERPQFLFSINPISYFEWRNAGVIYALGEVSSEEFPEGNGIYFVGENHVKYYLDYANRPEQARRAFRTNLYNNFIRKTSPEIRIWRPDDQINKFTLIKSMPFTDFTD